MDIFSPDFLLENDRARQLYHDHAAKMPIVDYHNHLSPQLIASDHQFRNLTELWLEGDHYKWRAMRANGIPEKYITGKSSDEEKFAHWAATVPYTLRNPLFHWTHLELNQPFGIQQYLNPETAEGIYQQASAQLQSPDFSTRGLLRQFGVTHLCTTDDPCDTLEAHASLAGGELKIFPSFRPDRALDYRDPVSFNAWVDKLGKCCQQNIDSYAAFLEALELRHAFFHAQGCRLADHGLAFFPDADFSYSGCEASFARLRSGEEISDLEQRQLAAALLLELARMHHRRGWVQQYHIGPLRNTNTRLQKLLGADAGCDTIGDWQQGPAMARFFARLDAEGQLARTIIYNSNPRDNALFATMAANFNDESCPGKMQYGAAWWFLDQKEGMLDQLNCLSNHGLLSRWVGMLTDSRSFLSFSRHDYFRRIFCNLIGQEMSTGELPDDPAWMGQLVENVCYGNAMRYFGFSTVGNEAAKAT